MFLDFSYWSPEGHWKFMLFLYGSLSPNRDENMVYIPVQMENIMSEQIINSLVSVDKWAKCKKYVISMVFHPTLKQYV